MSPNLVIVTLAEQTSEQSRKQGGPPQHLHVTTHVPGSHLQPEKSFLGCALLQLFVLLGTLCIFCIYQSFTLVFCLMLFCFLVNCYFFTYIYLYLLLTSGKRLIESIKGGHSFQGVLLYVVSDMPLPFCKCRVLFCNFMH